jgi:hypothetical protein
MMIFLLTVPFSAQKMKVSMKSILLLLNVFQEKKMVLHSVDYVQTEQGVDDNELQAPIEYLNSINGSRLHLSKLDPKIGCTIMVLWNMSPEDRVCNGTKAILTRATKHVLEICIKRNTALGALIQEVDLIIWDEVPMQSKLCQEAVDLTLQDIQSSSPPFGGITVVFGGDFQQILPVVVKEGREETVSLCISRSKFWHHVERLKLTRNMWLDNASQEERDFNGWLLDVGHGKQPLTREYQTISLPATMKCALVNTIVDLITTIYPGLPHLPPRTANSNNVNERHDYDEFFMDRTILSS